MKTKQIITLIIFNFLLSIIFSVTLIEILSYVTWVYFWLFFSIIFLFGIVLILFNYTFEKWKNPNIEIPEDQKMYIVKIGKDYTYGIWFEKLKKWKVGAIVSGEIERMKTFYFVEENKIEKYTEIF